MAKIQLDTAVFTKDLQDFCVRQGITARRVDTGFAGFETYEYEGPARALYEMMGEFWYKGDDKDMLDIIHKAEK